MESRVTDRDLFRTGGSCKIIGRELDGHKFGRTIRKSDLDESKFSMRHGAYLECVLFQQGELHKMESTKIIRALSELKKELS